jgi:hypothetical protein
MASTRNKNTPGNYALEQWSLEKQFQSKTYIHGAQGRPIEPLYAGNGLKGGRIVARDLAKNDCDIESFLFGIGSTNLVTPLAPVQPELNDLKTLDIIQKKPMYVPEPLIVEPHQRHFYLN